MLKTNPPASGRTYWTFLLLLGVGLAPFTPTSLVAASPNPNIVLMMADDMGMGDTSAYQDFTGNADSEQVHTPNMERLARMGVRFTDAHTPTSRCSGTRYGLLTGRYPWRNRLKHWVLFGAQGDPMIEADRPTLASMLRSQGYRTAIVGKWHVGLRYRQSNGKPAAGWMDADLTQPLHTSPIDYGFDFSRITSRSHGTSGPDAGNPKNPKNRGANKRGPGHLHGRRAIGATTTGRQLVKEGPNAYVLSKLGSRHSDSTIAFLSEHVSQSETKTKPFFLYYPANSNHGPYTPDTDIDGTPVAGAARTKSGKPMDARHDFIYENDVALGRLLDWLESEDDPRHPGSKLIANTLVIFTSDNGAEKKSNIATGPFRSNKGSAYEGGHRVPFLVAWADGLVGDADSATLGETNASVIALQDLFATFAELVEAPLPNLSTGEKGAEDSRSVLAAFQGGRITQQNPLFHSDHNEAKADRAACAMRLDISADQGLPEGQWKLFFDADLIRFGTAKPVELYNLASDSREKHNVIDAAENKALVDCLVTQALLHRNVGGYRLAAVAAKKLAAFDFQQQTNVSSNKTTFQQNGIEMFVQCANPSDQLICDEQGLGISQGESKRVDSGEAIEITFDQSVVIESATIIAGQEGVCGGFYRVGNDAPLAIYCIDGDNDAQDQHGLLSDIGVLKAGKTLLLESSPHFGVESKGAWQLGGLKVRSLK